MKTKNIATYGLLVALAFILSYLETLFPLPVPVPGIKLGLANLVVVIALYNMGAKEAFILSIVRIVMVGFSFGSLSTMLFSLAGGMLSWVMMVLFKKSKLFSLVGVSIIGGIAHNIGQIAVSILIVENVNIIYYLPVLLISGVITGTLIGILGAMIVKRLKNF
ncbi:MAG: putative rane protein [Herbinix sp.]|jgi:heptaprenyl diphosphate synthase|nr:putative rane protein [Herbinix sp.]